MYSNELVCNILNYINKNINKEITINELSNIYFYDKTYIMKKFKKELGITIKEYINHKKILNSLSLYNPQASILNIAFNSGFNSIEYYSEVFNKLIGVSPRIYKKFITPLNTLEDNKLEKIRSSILNIIMLDNKINDYLFNRRPQKYPVKKLSIFS
ncbi:MAG: helix-turn-helix transcriptional regulator [Bacilli bacterium]